MYLEINVRLISRIKDNLGEKVLELRMLTIKIILTQKRVNIIF